MVFSSIIFIFTFLPAVLIFYYLIPKKYKNLILLLFSLLFYAWGEPIYVLLIIFSIVFNYVIGIDIDYNLEEPRKAKFSLLLAITVNLFILGFFKYYGFLIDNLNNIFSLSISYSKLALPVGLSFYTFQTISYLADVYCKKTKVQKKFIPFALYVSMFPQLVAGPIVKYSDINAQLEERKESAEKFGDGIIFFILGLSKKVILADNMGIIFNEINSASVLSFFSAWIGAFAVTFQIYFDFSGYSDMAIGLGKMFGFDIKKNFNYPYQSTSVTDFWRRWHISLGTWFREYVYIPLGGNKVKIINHIRNILIVWILTGLWHGASWNFIVWGFYYGIILIFEKFVLNKLLKKVPFIVGNIYTMFLVIIGWILFFSDTLKDAFKYLSAMFYFKADGLYDKTGIYYFITNIIMFILCILCSASFFNKTFNKFFKRYDINKIYIMIFIYIGLFLISISYLISNTYNPFLYFRF